MARLRGKKWIAWVSAAVASALLATLVSVALTSTQPASAITYARNAWWVNGPLGETLRITPSGPAQIEGVSAASGVMSNALKIAGRLPFPTAVYDSLFEQLQCHLTVRLKTPYDLDTYRPSVSFATELRDECNPPPSGTVAVPPSTTTSTAAPAQPTPPQSAPPVTSPPATTPPQSAPPTPSPPATNPPQSAPPAAPPPTASQPETSLTVNATAAFGTCTAPDTPSYCGADAHSQPDPNFVASRGIDEPGGTQATGLCWEYGGNVNAPASGENSNVWIETTLSPDPWMNVLYFPPGAQDGLDEC